MRQAEMVPAPASCPADWPTMGDKFAGGSHLVIIVGLILLVRELRGRRNGNGAATH